MKRILTIAAAALVLAACAALEPAKFDPVEQQGWTTLWQRAKRLEQACAQERRNLANELLLISSMYEAAEFLGAYLQYLPDAGSQGLAAAYMKLLADVKWAGSATYCQGSAINLQEAAERAMKVNGARPR
jgi:hypothetical protein